MAVSGEPFMKMEAISPATMQYHSPSHSPAAPYLIGGLAAMSCLVALALLVLIGCSYYLKLSATILGSSDSARDLDLESSGEGNGNGGDARNPVPPAVAVFDDKILVIMAGEVKPSFIATHMPSSVSNLDCNQIVHGRERNEKVAATAAVAEQGGGDPLQCYISR